MTEDTPYRLHASLGYKLSLAARMQERRLEEGLRALGLTRTSWCILLAAGVEGLTRPSDIAAFVGIDRATTSRALRQMEEAGLIARSGAGGDGRARKVAVTGAGRALIGRGAPLARDNAARLAAKLAPAEEETLARLLDALIEGEALALRKL